MLEYLNMVEQLGIPLWLFVVFLVWSSIWKILALWKSARKNSPVWFVILFLVNTIGILEIFYIFVFSEMKCCSKEKVKSRRKKRR